MTTTGRDRTLDLADGRLLSWAEYGDPAGRPVVVLHGTPGSRLQFASLDDAARQAGVRVIAPERPGCGRSSPCPGLTFGGYADDLRQLLDGLGLPRVTLAGVSGGGGFALAAAGLLSERVARLLLVCAIVPEPPSETLHGQAPHVRRLFSLARRLPWLTATLLGRLAQTRREPGPKLEKSIRALPEADKRVMRAQAEGDDALAVDAREGVRQSARPAVHELQLYARPSDVPLSQVTVPTLLLHGLDDVNVPIAVARWLGMQLPDAELVEVPDAGHLFLFERPQLLLERVG